MDRKSVLLQAFQRGPLLTINQKLYTDWIDKFIVGEIEGDVGAGDITTESLIDEHKSVKAEIYTRTAGIAAGLSEVKYILEKRGIHVKELASDGDHISAHTLLFQIEGNAREILKIERSCLDIIARMSGIATLTHTIKNRVKHAEIAPTRKTQWKYLDKKAAFVGGGLTHRLALWDAILIKDNHLDALKGAIDTALERAWKHKKTFVEIEVCRAEDALLAARKFKELGGEFPRIIMLDNMPPSDIKSVVGSLKKEGLYDHVLLEASGGIQPETIAEYDATGVDVISLGYLTSSVQALDIKLRIL
ncbi:MAG TPA: carboxylating nicotinate-nucleotide diphosphorylase [Candidatus Nanoarchaeia archaeon]|nr:carboxylating nicotinate-nucleotide diphosphorylase [Candidatus Nanoarchaeia archaeon]